MGRKLRTADRTASDAAVPHMGLMPWDQVAAEYGRRHPGERMYKQLAFNTCQRAERKLLAALLPWAEAYGLVPAAER